MNKKALLEALFGKVSGGPSQEPLYLPPDEKVEEVLAMLPPREKFVIEHRFADESLSLKAIGEICPDRNGRIGVSGERVRQIEARALRRMRHPSRSRVLWPGSV